MRTCFDFNKIDLGPLHLAFLRGCAFLHGSPEGFPGSFVSCIHFDQFRGFRVLQKHPTSIGQFPFAPIVDDDAHRVMARGAPGEGLFTGRIQKIRDHEDDRAAGEGTADKIQAGRERGFFALGLEKKDVTNDAKNMRLSLAGGDEQLDRVGHKDKGNAVVVLQCAECEDRRDLGRQLALGLGAAAEQSRGAEVEGDDDRKLAFLTIPPDVGNSRPRGHIPIDAAHFIAGLIGPNILEIDPATSEYGVVGADE